MKKNLRVVTDFFKEHKLRFLVVLVLVLIFLVAEVTIQLLYNHKVYKEDDYIFTYDYIEDEGYLSRLPYINMDTKEAKRVNDDISEYFYNTTSARDNIFDYEIAKEKNHIILTINIIDAITKRQNDNIVCDINIKNKKIDCTF